MRAMKMIKSSPGIDLILMDMDLGLGMDGTEAAAVILETCKLTVVSCQPKGAALIVDFWNDKPEGSTILFGTVHAYREGYRIPVEVIGIFFRLKDHRYLFGVARNISWRWIG
jgi:hypothetical protein